MIDDRLTAAAHRALAQAALLAQQNRAGAVETVHLLWALVHDESRAAEMLAAAGATPDALRERLSLEWLPGEPPPSADDPSPPLPRHSEPVQRVLVEAGSFASQAGRAAPIGSEHLLYGLSVVPTEVAAVLESVGLTEVVLAERVRDSSGQTLQPLEVDLTWEPTGQPPLDRTDVLRILDASANRAREGLRVAEDFARFVLDDGHLTARLKSCRHRLREALAPLDGAGLLAARDTLHDVGTGISTPSETERASSLDVVRASFKRAEEALRSLEEFGKTVEPGMGDALGTLRYELYSLEKAVLTTHNNRRRFEGRELYLLLTESLCRAGWETTVRDALRAGAGIVQLREKDRPDREIVELGRRLREWTRDAGALFLMNDRPDLAVLTDADGVHVGQDELTVRQARRIVGPGRLVGVSTHTIEQARQAVLDGADYLGVGPVFPSGTKRFDELAGLEFVRQVAAEITLPWYAIGGIDADNVAEVIQAGASRVAVSGAVCGAEKPGAAAAELLKRLNAE